MCLCKHSPLEYAHPLFDWPTYLVTERQSRRIKAKSEQTVYYVWTDPAFFC